MGESVRGAASAVLLICLLTFAVACAAAGPAAAQGSRAPGSSGGLPTALPGTPIGANALVTPARPDVVPPGRRRTAERVGAAADAVGKVRRERREYPRSTREVFLKGVDRWQVSYFARTPPGAPRKE